MKSLIFQPTKATWLHELGREAQTRRVIKPQPPPEADEVFWFAQPNPSDEKIAPTGLWARKNAKHEDDTSGWLRCIAACPFKVGERRYVKELWRPYQGVHKEIIAYRGESQFMVVPRELAAHPDLDLNAEWTCLHDKGNHWRNPRFMPEWAARTIVQIASVRVEKVCEISEADVLLEGIHPSFFAAWSGIIKEGELPTPTVADFRSHWESIHGKNAPWESTWVWVVGLRTVEVR